MSENAPDLDGLISGTVDEWVAGLPAYQRGHIESMLKTATPTEVAIAWLDNSGPSDTAPFGGIKSGANLFYDNLLLEVQKVLCGSSEYERERSELLKAGNTGKMFLVAAISALIAPHVGAAAVIISPVVALILAVLSKAAAGTACEGIGTLITDRNSRHDASPS